MLLEAEISLARALLDGEALELADLLHAASDRSHPARSFRDVLVDERYVTLAEVDSPIRKNLAAATRALGPGRRVLGWRS